MNYRDQQSMSYSVRDAASGMDMGLRAYMLHVYNLMASALVLSAITAYAGANWQPLMSMLYSVHDGRMGLGGLGWIVAFAPFLMVMGLSAGIGRMSNAAAQGLYWAFAAVNGLSLSVLLLAYTGESVVRIFMITAIMFGSMSLWGYATKRDLTGMGHFMMMGLMGIIIAMLVNIFLRSSGLDFALSVMGVAIFTGLTAYDTQKIKGYYYQSGGGEMASKSAILGALNLYLDFINMFVMLLRLFGDRRN